MAALEVGEVTYVAARPVLLARGELPTAEPAAARLTATRTPWPQGARHRGLRDHAVRHGRAGAGSLRCAGTGRMPSRSPASRPCRPTRSPPTSPRSRRSEPACRCTAPRPDGACSPSSPGTAGRSSPRPTCCARSGAGLRARVRLPARLRQPAAPQARDGPEPPAAHPHRTWDRLPPRRLTDHSSFLREGPGAYRCARMTVNATSREMTMAMYMTPPSCSMVTTARAWGVIGPTSDRPTLVRLAADR